MHFYPVLDLTLQFSLTKLFSSFFQLEKRIYFYWTETEVKMKFILSVFWTFMCTNFVKGQEVANTCLNTWPFGLATCIQTGFCQNQTFDKICAHKSPKLRVDKLHFDLHCLQQKFIYSLK